MDEETFGQLVEFKGREVREGDRVKVRWTRPGAIEGMTEVKESIDWMSVHRDGGGDLLAGGRWVLGNAAVTILDHDPQAVTVTLGWPLTNDVRRSYGIGGVRLLRSPGGCIRVGTGASSSLLSDRAARRMALDILATVGVE